ncbi:unnamed protein product [Lactuca virosa]|nr:unnamed protein product [Lactuca virosa]
MDLKSSCFEGVTTTIFISEFEFLVEMECPNNRVCFQQEGVARERGIVGKRVAHRRSQEAQRRRRGASLLVDDVQCGRG